MEAQLSAHIRHLLLDYVQCHIVTDYVQFTEAAVAEASPTSDLKRLLNPSLTLPSDPYVTLSHIYKLENLSLPQEKFATTQDALQFLKKSIAPPKEQTKSEYFSWRRDAWDECQDDAFYRVESILTRRAVRETPVLGKSGGARRAQGMQKVELDSYARLMASKPVVFKPVDVDPVQEPQVKLNQVLDVVYNLKAEDHAAVRTYLQSVVTMCRPQLATPSDIKKDYRRAYLPAGFVFDPPRPATPSPDSPPLIPIFARSARYKSVENRDVKNGVLRSYAELPGRLDALGEAKILDSDDDMDLARASMVVVDGWQTYAVSSPSTVSSVGDEEFDQLADMFPSSPDTSVVDAMNLVEDVENSKFGTHLSGFVAALILSSIDVDEVQIPKNRRIGGSLGLPRESVIDKARKAGGLGAFLIPLLNPSDSNCVNIPTSGLHSLLHDNMSTLSRKDPKDSSSNKREEDREEPSSKIQESDVDSMRGQASAASSLGGGAMTEEDNEIRGLYLDLSRPRERRLGPPLPRELPDPKALIRDEPLFEEETKGGEEKNSLTLKLMPIPVLPDPNVDTERSVRGYSDYLVGRDAQTGGNERNVKAGQNTSPLQFLKNTKRMASLRVALSWVPFTCTTPIPVHAGLLQYDLEVGEAAKSEADALLKKVCAGGVAGVGGCDFGDDTRWRKCGGQDENGNEQFSEEIAKCEIILTRKERKALLARERRLMEDECDAGKGNEGVGGEQSGKRIEVVNTNSSEPNGSRIAKASTHAPGHREQDENEGSHRPVKRARMSIDDSSFSMMEMDGSSHNFDSDQDDSWDTADNMLQDAYQDNSSVIMNGLEASYDDDDVPIKQTTRTVIGPDGYDHTDVHFANTDDDNSGMIPVEGKLLNQGQGQQGWSGFSDPSTLSNGSHTRYAHASEARFNSDNDTMYYEGRTFTDATVENRDYGRVTVNSHVPQRAVTMKNSQHVGADDEDSDRSRSFKDTSFKNLSLDLASHSLGIEAFAKLRAKPITIGVPLPTDRPTQTADTQELDEPLPRILSKTTPTELYDDKTVRIPSHLPRSQTVHKYMASVDLLQKQVLVRSLASRECLVELIERDSLGGADLIIDPQTAVIFTCLLSLPAHCNKLLERLSAQSWRYKRVLIVFEAYPESRSFRQRQKQGIAEPEPELYAYTPPIVKAIKRFRRDVAIAEGCGKKSIACDVWCAFANSVSEATTCARLFGDEAERADWTEGALWGNREWLDADESEDEKNLALISGMNWFSAAVVLCQMTLQQFFDLTPEERLAMVGPLIGNEAITAFNLEIEERIRVTYEDATDVMSCA
ncbi:hypothetical protein C0995_006044 [Termitomyces sp. Mi166|nr:hypothetical protein C0995_006044 [Termitomyces sp. Mi166\